MTDLYASLSALIRSTSDADLPEHGKALIDHVIATVQVIPPTQDQARAVWEAIERPDTTFHEKRSRATLLPLCGEWTDKQDPWFSKICGRCIKKSDFLSLRYLLDQPGAPQGGELSQPIGSKSNPANLSLTAQVLTQRPSKELLDLLRAKGCDFNAPCFFGQGHAEIPLSYKPSTNTTLPLLARGARLGGVAPDGKPVWSKVFKRNLALDNMAHLISAMATMAKQSQDLREDLRAHWGDILPHLATFLAQSPYGKHHASVALSISNLAKAANLAFDGSENSPSFVAMWAREELLMRKQGKDKNDEHRPAWRSIAVACGAQNPWAGQVVPGVNDGIWALLGDIHQPRDLQAPEVRGWEGGNPQSFWKTFNEIIQEKASEQWTWHAVSRLRGFMPAEIRVSTSNATGKEIYAELDRNPHVVGKGGLPGMSILGQALSSVVNGRDEHIDKELANVALAAHFLAGWRSKVAIDALRQLAGDTPDWLDGPLIVASYHRCPRKFKDAEKIEMDALIMSLSTVKAPQIKLGSRRL